METPEKQKGVIVPMGDESAIETFYPSGELNAAIIIAPRDQALMGAILEFPDTMALDSFILQLMQFKANWNDYVK